MKYDDLLNVPYKPHGRNKNGFDCYGLVIELCKRNGTPLKDIYNELDCVPKEALNDYISKGLNVKETKEAKTGNLALCLYHENLHIAYIAGRNLAIHATVDKGVRITPLSVLHPVIFYEVINENKSL